MILVVIRAIRNYSTFGCIAAIDFMSLLDFYFINVMKNLDLTGV